MNFISIIDYPYITIKKFFETIEGMHLYITSNHEPYDSYCSFGKGFGYTTRLLNRNNYVLKSYKETINQKEKVNIDYIIDWDKKIK